MKAAVYTKYGPPDVVQIKEVPMPVLGDSQVLVRIHATTVNSSDWRMRSGIFPAGFTILARLALGVFGPRNRVLGAELAGVVESIGKDVQSFKPGDRVFAGGTFGGHAEYKAVNEDSLALMPDNLGFDEAAALSFGGTTALFFLCEKGAVQRGEKVLVNGASGSTGLAAIQIAKHAGVNVTAVCSAANFDLVKSLGADNAIDYTTDDFTKSGELYDIIYDAAGTAPWRRSKGALSGSGRLLVVLGSLWGMITAPFVSRKGGKKVINGTSGGGAKRLRILAELAQNGQYSPVIDRRYPFEEIVEAHAYVDTGHKKGSVVITILPNSNL